MLIFYLPFNHSNDDFKNETELDYEFDQFFKDEDDKITKFFNCFNISEAK